jgi:hypothetical protein
MRITVKWITEKYCTLENFVEIITHDHLPISFLMYKTSGVIAGKLRSVRMGQINLGVAVFTPQSF